jgi:hypothetical protein
MKTRFLIGITMCMLILALSSKATAQDTTTVQTLQWEDNFRSGYYDFPDDGQSYRKILMYYNMRCPDAAINPGDNSQGCGEWDYSCNTFITDTTRIDSSKATHPSHLISNFSGDVFNYTSQETFTYINHPQYSTTFSSVNNEMEYSIGTANTELELPVETQTNKLQILFTEDELQDAGLQAGLINRLKLNITQTSGFLKLFKIKMKNVDEAELDPNNVHTEGFTEVYHQNLEFFATGNFIFNLYQAFNWEAGKNILVEISYVPDSNDGNALKIQASTNTSNATMSHHSNDKSAYFNRNGYYELNTSNIQGTYDEITVAFWSYGDESIMPANNSILECSTDNGRQVNIHLPWSNGQVYWDCGNVGSGYDRINKPAEASDYRGKWTHWAFTKNLADGSMKIYLNGNEWHSGSGFTNTIEINEAFRIGSNIGSNSYFGKMDDLSIWKTALESTDIQNLMGSAPTNEHPMYDQLLTFMNFNDLSSQQVTTLSSYNVTAKKEGQPFEVVTRSEDAYKQFTLQDARPVISFYQGEYELNNNISNYLEAIPKEPNSVVSFYTANNDLLVTDTSFVYEAGYQYIYDPAGAIVDSVLIDQEASINIETLNYYNKTDAKYEILSLVTPYGFFIDLGDDGKTFIFDVTDYAPILKGNRRLSIEMGGQNQEDLDIKFLFISGTPEREVMNIQNIWPFRRAYPGGLEAESYFEPRSISLAPFASYYKIRSTITGHGQNGEFVPQEHFINVNGGSKEFNYEVWKYCGQNPIYPQGGTWIFDRAGWCPGTPSDIHQFKLDDHAEPGETITLDYGLNTSSGSSENYLVSNQLVTYGAYNFSTDASIERVISPTAQVENERINPACNEAQIEVKNTGNNILNSITVRYQVLGTDIILEETFTLDLESGENQILNLPVDQVGFFANGQDTGRFQADIVSVNGSTDDYSDNNTIQSTFEQVDTFSDGENLLIRLLTNNTPEQNSYSILDNTGTVVFSKNNFQAGILYKDEISLSPGCYTLVFQDTGNDGLDFWYWAAVGQNVGTGSLSINKKINDVIDLPLKVFNPDFGGTLYYDFVVGEITDTKDPVENSLLSVYPNPAQEQINIELQGLEGSDMRIDLLDLNGKIQKTEFVNSKPFNWQSNWKINGLASGIYLVRITSKEYQFSRKIVID